MKIFVRSRRTSFEGYPGIECLGGVCLLVLQHAKLWQHFGEDPFLFQHDSAPVHKANSTKGIGVDLLTPDLHSPVLVNYPH